MGKLLSSQASVSPHTKPMIPRPWAHCKGSNEIAYVKLLEHRRGSLNVRSLPYPLSQPSSWNRLLGYPEFFFLSGDCLSVLLGTGALGVFIKTQFKESQFITFILPNGGVASHQLSLGKIAFGK